MRVMAQANLPRNGSTSDSGRGQRAGQASAKRQRRLRRFIVAKCPYLFSVAVKYDIRTRRQFADPIAFDSRDPRRFPALTSTAVTNMLAAAKTKGVARLFRSSSLVSSCFIPTYGVRWRRIVPTADPRLQVPPGGKHITDGQAYPAASAPG